MTPVVLEAEDSMRGEPAFENGREFEAYKVTIPRTATHSGMPEVG